jgi:isocitrate dehydrogenase
MKIIKYIINDKDIPVLFSTEIVHKEVIQNIKSAGFLSIRYDISKQRFLAKCFGESSSLDLVSNIKVDEKIIESFLNE